MFGAGYGTVAQVKKCHAGGVEINHTANLAVMPVERAGIDQSKWANTSNHGFIGMATRDKAILFRLQQCLKVQICVERIALMMWTDGGHVVCAEFVA